MKGAGVLSRPEVDFLQAVASSRDKPVKWRAVTNVAPEHAPPTASLRANDPEELLALPQSSDLDIAECGPRAAGKMLKRLLEGGYDRADWVDNARIQAIVGSCPKSHESAKSGMRFWAWFAVHVLGCYGDILPPDLDGLLAWSRLFRCHGTFGNYLSYVKPACEIKGVCVDAFAHPSLKRAKAAIEKRRRVGCINEYMFCVYVSVV